MYNFATLFANSSDADPVFLNILGNALDDIETDAEYVAYGTNYLSSITGRRVATYGWSQASILLRWATKYWPSTIAAAGVSIQSSPDYRGSLSAAISCAIPDNAYAPALLQQGTNSTFLTTLRNNGGGPPHFPLTSIYSAFDDVVQPQVSGPDASEFSSDAHGVGVTNGVILPGGSAQNIHEGVLYNALAIALANDTLAKGMNANPANVDITSLCEKFAPDGMSLTDVALTISAIIVAGVNIVDAPNKSFTEPPIKAYARKDIPHGYSI